MAPRTRKQVAKRRAINVIRDADGIEEHEQHQIEQEPEVEVQQPIQKQGIPPTTRRATASRDASSVFQDKQKLMDNRQSQNFPQASREQGMGPRTRKAIGNQSMSRRLLEMDQMEGGELHGQHQNEELESPMAQQTNSRQVTACRSQRSTVNRRINHGWMDEDEMEEGGQQENEQQSNLEVAEALKNALQILTASSTRRAATVQNSHIGFQDTLQREENRQWHNRRQMQPPVSQQVSMMAPSTRKATRNHLGYNTLRDEIQMEEDEEQPEFQMTERVTAPSTQRSTMKRKLNDLLFDEDEIDEQDQQGNEQSNLGITQEIENALKILMAPSTRRALSNLNSNSGFRDKNQIKENWQLQNRKQPQPEISHQASMMASRTRKATTIQSGYHRFQDEDHLERERQNENQEQPEFQMPRQTKDKQVMTRSTQRSTARVNQGLLDEDEIEEHVQQENEQVSDVDVSQAIENALKILMTPSTRKETTNENSHCGLQDRQQQSRQQQQLQASQQASISAVMPPRTQNTAGNQSSFHSLQDEDQIEEGEEQQNEEPIETEMAQLTNSRKGSRKKPRGPTLLRDIWGRNPDEEGIKVNFNKRGQPVGPGKKKFTGFLGTLARNGRYSPLDIDDWRKVPKENKDAMIKLVKERFEIPEGVEHWILLSIGRKRNDWRARVKSLYYDPLLPIEDQIHKIPPRVTKEQWKNLCSYWADENKMVLEISLLVYPSVI